jgi:hypothetical protein
MTAVAYPSTLPLPQVWAAQGPDRRATSSLPGNTAHRARWRDRVADIEVRWAYTAAQMATWRAWYEDTLLDGQLWFAMRSAGEGGLDDRVFRFRPGSLRRELMGGGVFRVSATLQQRGLGVPPIEVAPPPYEPQPPVEDPCAAPPPPPPPTLPELFIAVSASGVLGDGQHVMTSPDGVTWTIRSSITTYDGAYRDVTLAPELGLVVAVGLNNDLYSGTPGLLAQVITSPDGLTWSRQDASDTSNWWSCVEWAPELGLFCALSVGTDGGGSGTTHRVMTSPDGLAWTNREAAQAIAWRDLAWSPSLGLFAAVANAGTNRVMTSPDGINWTTRTPAADNNWLAICWSPELDLFVAVSDSGTNRVMTSPDGINWTSRTPEANAWLDVIWCDTLSLFVAVAATGTNRVMTSPDGTTWTPRTAAAANVWSALAFDGTTIVAVSQSGSGNRVMTSTDGASWSTQTSAADKSWVGLVWAGS